MGIMISVHPLLGSKYFDYFHDNMGHFARPNQRNIFHLPLKLYNYWVHKQKLKIKGVRKIVVVISEFDYTDVLPPGTELGAICEAYRYFDFDKLTGIKDDIEARIFFINNYHGYIEGLGGLFGWPLDEFRIAHERTLECLLSEQYPKDFDQRKIVV